MSQTSPRRRGTPTLALALTLLSTSLVADDWPGYRGPTQDGRSTEVGVFDGWPAEGPATLWRAELGSGYSVALPSSV